MSGNPNLTAFNLLPPAMAQAALLACCGSAHWAERMEQQRPFANTAALLAAADAAWRELPPEDWRQAFAAHPRIGERPRQESPQERVWSEQEQAAARLTASTEATLAEANRAYQDRFGYIFIVCATGKSADEMLAILGQRLQNNADTELQVAAEEQRKITGLRLKRLLGL